MFNQLKGSNFTKKIERPTIQILEMMKTFCKYAHEYII